MLAHAAALLLALCAARREPAFVAVVDPGHGGEQEGAIGPGGAKEKDLALEIARRVAGRLKKLGAKVVLTRTGDIAVPLANRAAIANAMRADLFVSIHLNSMPTAEQRRVTHGVETYFLSADATDTHASAVAARENADRLAGEPGADPDDPVASILSDLEDAASLQNSSRLAYAVHERLVEALGAEDRGVKQAPFYVLAGARMPAVLLEVGFISNTREAEQLRSREYQERIAGAVADGIARFRAETRRASR
ncbi:MAG TPA: N-acetylmuramoyl-L-alanine amidase [Anaeromyxobacter sp.]|nr:N-acetylmuramoyl-L-alanine amidase [Anaeromyxobacter sp.]